MHYKVFECRLWVNIQNRPRLITNALEVCRGRHLDGSRMGNPGMEIQGWKSRDGNTGWKYCMEIGWKVCMEIGWKVCITSYRVPAS